MKKYIFIILAFIFAIDINAKEVFKNNQSLSINPGSSVTYVTRISATIQTRIMINRSQDGTHYDVYITNEQAESNTKVKIIFPDNEVNVDNNVGTVLFNAGQFYTFIKASNPTDLIDVSMAAGGRKTYTCPCCTGNGNCTITGEVEPGGEPSFSCDASSCVAPTDGTVTCELKVSSGMTGGGVILNCAASAITIHQN